MTSGNVLQCRRGAPVWDVIDLDAQGLSEERRCEVSGASGARMRHFRRLRLHPGDQFGKSVCLQRFPADQYQRVVVDEGDGGKVLLGIEIELRKQRDVRRDLQVMKEQRVTVRRR